mmetsp:Transcript_83568/g.233242  ORF Transcript_83568/g.233242 Transcript_83568/m.233242 type:complete len:205 (-) Transcript_83568:2-616(-)
MAHQELDTRARAHKVHHAIYDNPTQSPAGFPRGSWNLPKLALQPLPEVFVCLLGIAAGMHDIDGQPNADLHAIGGEEPQCILNDPCEIALPLLELLRVRRVLRFEVATPGERAWERDPDANEPNKQGEADDDRACGYAAHGPHEHLHGQVIELFHELFQHPANPAQQKMTELPLPLFGTMGPATTIVVRSAEGSAKRANVFSLS